MKIYVQLIENYLKQEVPTIILTVEKQKYIFNFPTCFQRFIKDHKQKFPKGSVIFFTRASSETLAGLSGFMLTIFESKLCQDTRLYVPDSIFHYLEQVRYKMGFKILPYSYSNLFTHESRLGVRNVEKVYELLGKENYAQIFMNSQKYISQNLPAEERNDSSKYLNQKREFYDGEMRVIAFEVQAGKERVTNYICIPNKLEGKVMMERVKQLKVPNKLISKLLSEGSLQLEDGTVVKAEQIKQPDSASPNLLILHFTSLLAIEMALDHPILKAYLSNPQNVTESIIHIVEDCEGERLVESKQFSYLLSRFPNKVKHILYSRDYGNKDYNLIKEPVFKHMELASFVHKYFPASMPDILGHHYSCIAQHSPQVKLLEDLFPHNWVMASRRCHELVLAPKKNQGYFPINEGLNQKEKQKKQYLAPEGALHPPGTQSLEELKGVDPQIVFLGTGSMKPSKYRNVSSIYVEVTPEYSLLLDCGEGSYFQLFNHFGWAAIDAVTLRVRTIFITHIHSDHNLGILDFISQRNKLLRKKYRHKCQSDQQYAALISDLKLVLIIPYNVLPWFDSYITNIENLLDGCDLLFVQTILNESLQQSNATVSKDERYPKITKSNSQMKDEKEESDPEQCDQGNQELEAYFSPQMKALHLKYAQQQPQILSKFERGLNEAGISQFVPVHVDHCPQSFAIVLGHKAGVKISYSGDCRPSLEFAKAAHKSTLLIHEATFGDDLADNAIQNMHSTVGEAIDLAMQSESWKLALTHFSQRYISAKEIVDPSLYKLNEQKRAYASNHSIVCFDHLQMRVSQLPLAVYQSKKICEIFPTDSLE